MCGVRNKTAAGGERIEVAWDWEQTLWTERNRQRWVPGFLAASQAYWSETQIKKCEDEEMNFDTDTSWVTIALDMYLCTGVRPPAAHGGRRGLGTVKVWRSSFWQGAQLLSGSGAGLCSNDIKEVEGVRQQEEQEYKRDEEIGDEVNGEVEEVTQHTHET